MPPKRKAPAKRAPPAERKAPAKRKAPAERKAPVERKAPAEPKAPAKRKVPAKRKAPVERAPPAVHNAPVHSRGSRSRHVDEPLTWSWIKDEASLPQLRQALRERGVDSTGTRPLLEARLVMQLSETELQQASSVAEAPDMSQLVEKTRHVILDDLAKGVIFSTLMVAPEKDLVHFIENLDKTFTRPSAMSHEQLVLKAVATLSMRVKSVCRMTMMKDVDTMRRLRESAKGIGLDVPAGDKAACVFFQSNLTSVDAMLITAQGAKDTKSFWGKLGVAYGGIKSAFKWIWDSLWASVKHVQNAIYNLVASAGPLLKPTLVVLGTTAAACKAAPEKCVALFNGGVDFLCNEQARKSGFCKKLHEMRCYLMIEGAKGTARYLKAGDNEVNPSKLLAHGSSLFNIFAGMAFKGASAIAAGGGAAGAAAAAATGVGLPLAVIVGNMAVSMMSAKFTSHFTGAFAASQYGCDTPKSFVKNAMGTVANTLTNWFG